MGRAFRSELWPRRLLGGLAAAARVLTKVVAAVAELARQVHRGKATLAAMVSVQPTTISNLAAVVAAQAVLA